MMRLLQELRANLLPGEKESVGLPSSLLRILPKAESLVDDSSPPVKVNKTEWQRLEDPERLVRRFSFDGYSQLMTFVQDVMDYQQISKHYGDIKIGETQIQIDIWTKGIRGITEIDVEYSHVIDEIFHDIRFKHMGLK